MIMDRLNAFYDDIEYNVIKIAGRRNLIMLYDLAYFSVRKIPWNGNIIRGYLDVGAFGKTREGKSSIAERMLNHYQVGEFISGENVTPAGLIGGVDSSSNGMRILRWGRMPVNNRRLIFIDEAGNLSQQQIRNMNALRSSGIADIQKIKSGKTPAETRKIWIANPRRGQVDAYSRPIDMIVDLVGAEDSLARFDMIAIVDKQPPEDFKCEAPHIFTSKVCRGAILWAWGLEPDNIIIPDDTVQKTIKLSHKQTQDYMTDIPVVLEHEQPERLIRVAAAVAAKVMSWDESHLKLIIKPEHVETADQIMRLMIDDPAFKYKEYASVHHNYKRMLEDKGPAIAQAIRTKIKDYKILLKTFFKGETIDSLHSVYQLLGDCSFGQFRRIIALLEDLKFIKRSRWGVQPSPTFLQFIREHFLKEMNDVDVDVDHILTEFELKDSDDL